MRFKNGSNLKHLCLSKNEKRWQTKQEKMIKAHNGARSHALNHSSNGCFITSCPSKQSSAKVILLLGLVSGNNVLCKGI